MSRAKPRKIEASIQKAVVSWCRQRPLFAMAFHVDQGGRNTVGEASQAKKLGRLAGIPDLCIPLPEGRVLWLELKTKKGRLSAVQKAMHAEMRDFGQEVLTAFGYEQAVDILETIDSAHAQTGRE